MQLTQLTNRYAAEMKMLDVRDSGRARVANRHSSDTWNTYLETSFEDNYDYNIRGGMSDEPESSRPGVTGGGTSSRLFASDHSYEEELSKLNFSDVTGLVPVPARPNVSRRYSAYQTVLLGLSSVIPDLSFLSWSPGRARGRGDWTAGDGLVSEGLQETLSHGYCVGKHDAMR